MLADVARVIRETKKERLDVVGYHITLLSCKTEQSLVENVIHEMMMIEKESLRAEINRLTMIIQSVKD